MNQLIAPGVALLLGISGCMPFALPPAKLSVGAGPATGRVLRRGGELEPRSVTELRAGLHPLALIPGASERSFDAGIGYGGDLIFGRAPPRYDQRTSAHGPYLEAAYYPLRLPAGSATFRWGARGDLDLRYLEPENTLGWGGTLVTELELTGEAKGGFAGVDSDSAVLGVAWGQWSIAGFVGGSARTFPESHYDAITVGVSARIPFAAGIVCCAFISRGEGGHHDSSAPAASEQPKRRHETRPATPVRSSPPPTPPPERIPTPKRDELKP